MDTNVPTLATWRTLYDLAIRVRDMAPWDWMDETDIFAVQNPANNELGFVSIMGALGEHFAVAVYLGAKALHEFWQLQDEEYNYWPIQHVVEMPQLQASFEDRDDLEPSDHAIIKKLGLHLRGKRSWPMFRSHHPGYVP